jgi:hypothetical protein
MSTYAQWLSAHSTAQYRRRLHFGVQDMNVFTRWCYRIGLVCGAFALLSALVAIPFELGMSLPESLRAIAERAFSIFAPAFMFIGLVLLIAAFVWLRRSWQQLSNATKVVSVLGLLASTFLGAYIFHWLFPGVLSNRAQT